MNRKESQLTAIGWREWISFPEWDIDHMKVKVDTGARTSSLHVSKLEYFEKESHPWVRFLVHPWQETSKDSCLVESPVAAHKEVRSSSGFLEQRPVVITSLIVAGQEIRTEVTLTNRSQMGFRMLLGRVAIRKDFMVIPGRSYLGGKPDRTITRKNRGQI